MAGKVCAKCGSPNMSSSRFCARCGAPLKGAPGSDFPEQDDGQPGTLLLAGLWLLNLLPGLVRPKVVIVSVLALATAVGLGYLGFVMLMFGAVFAGGSIGAFALIAYWTAWAWMIYGELCVPAEALADFDGTQWLTLVLATVVPIGVVALKLGL